MPGSWALLELASRVTIPDDSNESFVQFEVGFSGMTLDVNFPSLSLLPTQISLAATNLKAQVAQMQAYRSHGATKYSVHSQRFLVEIEDWALLHRDTCGLLLSVQQFNDNTEHSYSIPSHEAGTSSVSAVGPALVMNTGTVSTDIMHGSSFANNSSNLRPLGIPSISHSLHQLSTLLVISLVRLNNWTLRLATASGIQQHQLDVLTSRRAWLPQLKKYDPQMGFVAAHLLAHASRNGNQAEDKAFANLEASMWGKYALEHLHGRLLPGCCHLGCTNLSGVSEAALLTLLCSGCKRARYCSVECQRAAWIEGGHRDICRRS